MSFHVCNHGIIMPSTEFSERVDVKNVGRNTSFCQVCTHSSSLLCVFSVSIECRIMMESELGQSQKWRNKSESVAVLHSSSWPTRIFVKQQLAKPPLFYPWFIHHIPSLCRCIRPNELKSPDLFQPDKVLTQLRCTGVLETTRIRREVSILRCVLTYTHEGRSGWQHWDRPHVHTSGENWIN